MNTTGNKNLELLRNATLKLLDPLTPTNTLRLKVLEIVEVLKNVSKFEVNLTEKIAHGGTWTDNGLALSPTLAAMCAKDYVRTVVFIRSLYDAIQDIRKRESDRPTRILYAGTGPYAILAIPLMSVFSVEEVQFELLDLHRESIESVKSLVKELEFSEYISNYEVIDAGLKQISGAELPDIIILELMNACLAKEPQVAITRHLLQQAPDAIIIPQSITIDAELVNIEQEFKFKTSEQKGNSLPRERISLGKVFELSRETVNLWKNEQTDRLTASLIKIPHPLGSKFQPLLFTQIQAYGNHFLQEHQSGLTSPITFPHYESIKGGETLQFHYQLGKSPGLICKAI